MILVKGKVELDGSSYQRRMISAEASHKVSIIVVNWNGERFLKDCLGALLSQSYADCEIILVDNGSSDNSVRFTRDNFPGIKIVALSGELYKHPSNDGRSEIRFFHVTVRTCQSFEDFTS